MRVLLPMFWPCLAILAASVGLEAPDRSAGVMHSVWTRHTIDRSSRGADGVRFADVDGDGRPDAVTGWEEGGTVRLYLHPGPSAADRPWPAVTVGRVPSVEDAVFADVDGDGRLDIVSSAEGDERRLYVHQRPARDDALLDSAAWTTTPLPAADGRMRWMFAAPAPIDHRPVPDLFAGGKDDGAEVGWFGIPPGSADLDAWTWHPLASVGWIMTLDPRDLDGDGDTDLLYSDRRGAHRGVRWLEHPGPAEAESPWADHLVGGSDHEVMFLAAGDLDGDGLEDLVAATAARRLLAYRRLDETGRRWEETVIPLPDSVGTGKGVAIGDLDGDGRADLVFSCERAEGVHGLMWLEPGASPWTDAWTPHVLSGTEGTKFDLIRLIDLDEDGDLDVSTCEERENLGVVWYENPFGR